MAAENKTKATAASVDDFIAAVPNPTRRADAQTVLKIMREVTGVAPKMWGPSIIGFGNYHYRSDAGREGDMCMAGFSPRKAQTVVYLVPEENMSRPLLSKLGKHSVGVSCLYMNNLADVDVGVLRQLVQQSWDYMIDKYGADGQKLANQRALAGKDGKPVSKTKSANEKAAGDARSSAKKKVAVKPKATKSTGAKGKAAAARKAAPARKAKATKPTRKAGKATGSARKSAGATKRKPAARAAKSRAARGRR